MAVGLPENISLSQWRKYPDPVKNILGTLYRTYLTVYLKTHCKIKYRKEKAPINPLKIIWINPQNVEKIVKHRNIEQVKDPFKPVIVDGDWDQKHTHSLHKNHTYTSLKKRFENHAKWEETKLYKKEKQKINRGKSMYGCKNIKDLEKVCKRIDQLYNNIKDQGYKTQKQLNQITRVHEKEYIDYYLNNLNEVIIDIDRKGELLLHDGRHRLTIAKILDLEKIPIRILIRHRKWQEKRNQAIQNPETLPEKLKQHPDIQYLFNLGDQTLC